MVVTVLSIICVVLAMSLGTTLYLLSSAGKAINEYDEFYVRLINQFEGHLQYLQNLTQNNVILSTDEDVKNVVKGIQSYYDMLLVFVNEGRTVLDP